MPYSAGENHDDVLTFVRENNIKRVLDIGPGSGTYGKLLGGEGLEFLHALEIWEPYVEQFSLNSIYSHKVAVGDVRKQPPLEMRYDLVIFGDVLEHMTKEESGAVWNWAKTFATYALISVPIVHYPQGESHGNPYEVHVQEHLHPEDIRRDYGPFIFDKEYDVTGMFIAKLNNPRSVMR